MQRLDYSPGFQLGHQPAFELAARIAALAGRPGDRVFFVNSGSEAVDTALKIAIGYHRVRGEASRTRVIGRERGYHGVGLGGISVGGIGVNRKMFASMMMPGVDHLPHTYSPNHMRFSRGQPQWGAHLADELERLVALHDASTIAAVIVEPVQGSTGCDRAAARLSRAAARDLQQARHPADLRRSDHRIRSPGQAVCFAITSACSRI